MNQERIAVNEENKAAQLSYSSTIPREQPNMIYDPKIISELPNLPPVIQPHIQPSSIGSLPPIKGSIPSKQS